MSVPVRISLVAAAKHLVGRRAWRFASVRYKTVRQSVRDRRENRRWRVSAPRVVALAEGGTTPHRGFIDWLGARRPDVRRHFHLGRLPCRLPRGTALLHAWVQDPVAERDPTLLRQLQDLEAECDRRGVGVVHRAAVLSHSKRDVLCSRLLQAGIRTPQTAVVDPHFDEHRGNLRLPLVVRPRWGHNRGMQRIDSEMSFGAWWRIASADPGGWIASEYIDVRSDDGFYRKLRYFMAGSRGVARHLIVSRHWEVRPEDRVTTPDTRSEELAFVGTPCLHHAEFDAARKALEFEIAAFDYSYDGSGNVVVWEVNPFPNLSRPAGEVGEYLTPTVERSYAMLADFYAERADL